MRIFTEILEGTWEGETHRKMIFTIWSEKKHTFYSMDPKDNTYYTFRNSFNNYEVGNYIKSGKNFFLWYDEPCFYK